MKAKVSIMKQIRHNISKLSYVLLSCFLVLILYIGIFSIIKGPELSSDPHNRRLALYEESVKRGTIYDRNGTVLAQGSLKQRVYPRGQDTAQVVGFISQRYGRTGLESAYDRELLAMTDEGKIEALFDKLMGRPRTGNDIVLTLDADLQRLILDRLGGRKGAVAVMDPRTGSILALVSSPTFDPNGLDQVVSTSDNKPVTKYENLMKDKDAPLLNRATQGAYPPGSVFKLITETAALSANKGVAQRTFYCPGELNIKGAAPIKDTGVHGQIDLSQALSVSCNTTFGQLGLEVGPDQFKATVDSFGLTKELKLEIPYRPGSIDLKGNREDNRSRLLASTAIGQGYLQVNPMNMALVAAGIANNGRVMQPYILREIRDPDGGLVHRILPKVWLTPTTPEIAAAVREGMVAVVKNGTGRAAALNGVTVAGKTGSAENPQGNDHAWFVGFAPAEKPRVVVAVIVENGGAGGKVAAPIARDIMAAALARP